MKISSKTHGILDYVIVIFLFISPTLFKMHDPLKTFTYTLTWVHFTLTVFTNFKYGIFKVIPFRIHGIIELIVSAGLITVAFWFNSQGFIDGFYFYLILAVAILIVFKLTDFNTVSAKDKI